MFEKKLLRKWYIYIWELMGKWFKEKCIKLLCKWYKIII